VEYKVCTKCSKSFTVDNFWKQSKAKDGLNTWCKGCITEGMKEGARKRKRAAVEQFGGTCYRCGGEFNSAVFDFHHKDPSTKETAIAVLLQSLALEHPKVQMELEKCIMLCSNCHRTVHATNENPVSTNEDCGK